MSDPTPPDTPNPEPTPKRKRKRRPKLRAGRIYWVNDDGSERKGCLNRAAKILALTLLPAAAAGLLLAHYL